MHKSTQDAGQRPKSAFLPTSTPVLDTNRTSAPSTKLEEALKRLKRRAQAKYATNLVAFPLAQLTSPLQKAYVASTYCTGELSETPLKFTAKYCGSRWCLVCSRMRTGRLIKGYLPAIEAMEEKWFLTLSRPNVAGPLLEDEVKYYLREASLIQRYLREKRKLQYSSLRKIECTYNQVSNEYHPHFHFIFDSQEAAQAFLDQWLSRNPTAKLNKGNQLKRANNKAVVELFKYFTKVASKSTSKGGTGTGPADYSIHLHALDTMFLAMRAVRTFQPCGVIKAISEDVEPEQVLESGRAEVNHWLWKRTDWMNKETRKLLTGYVPSEFTQDIQNHIVYPAGVKKAAPAADLTPFYVDKYTGEVVPNENAHQVRDLHNHFAKVYPGEMPDKRKRGDALRPLPPCAYFLGPDTPKPEPAAVLPTSVPAAPQMALFGLPSLPRIVSPAIKKAARPTAVPSAHRAAHLVDLATDTPNLLFL